MASPFRLFRKNQKILIAVAGVMAIFAFVLADPLMQMMTKLGGEGSQNPVRYTWTGKELRESDLYIEFHVRRVCREFLLRAREMGETMTGRQARVPVVVLEVTDDSTVSSMLLADRAKQLGFVVGDDIVNRYLELLTQNSVSQRELSSILQQVRQRNTSITESAIFDVLETALLAHQYIRSYRLTGATTMPNDRWREWKNLNDLIRLEMIPIAVESFLDQIDDPSEEELQEFYDLYRGIVRRPVSILGTEFESPDPGFMVPRKVSLEYLKADYDAIVAQLAEEVTDEEISEYYEENKDDFIRTELEDDSLTDSPTDGSTGDDESNDNENNDDKNNESGSAELTVEPANETDDETNNDGDTASEPSDQPAAADEAPSDDEAGDSAAEPDGSTTSIDKTAFRFASQATEEADESVGDPAGTNENEDASEQPPAPRPDTVENEPSPTDTTSEDDVAPDAAPASESPTSSATDDVDAAAGVDTADASSEENGYQPLDEVADDIRRQIARGKAGQEIERALTKPIEAVKDYADLYDAWDGERSEESDVDGEPATPSPQPTPPSLEKLAEENGLIYEKTSRLTRRELQEEAIGQCENVQSRQYVTTIAFGRPQLYEPFIARDDAFSQYLVWKVGKEAPHEVPLDEIREQVIRAWKMPKARELASEQAKKLADEATAKGGTLQETFGSTDEHKVVETDSFSYWTVGSALDDRGFLRLSEVDSVDGAAPAFLDKAFKLKPGDVDVATNHPQTSVYVIRLAGREKPLSELHEEFMRSVVPGDPLSFQLYQRMSQSEGIRAVWLLQENIVQKMDFKEFPRKDPARQ